MECPFWNFLTRSHSEAFEFACSLEVLELMEINWGLDSIIYFQRLQDNYNPSVDQKYFPYTFWVGKNSAIFKAQIETFWALAENMPIMARNQCPAFKSSEVVKYWTKL